MSTHVYACPTKYSLKISTESCGLDNAAPPGDLWCDSDTNTNYAVTYLYLDASLMDLDLDV